MLPHSGLSQRKSRRFALAQRFVPKGDFVVAPKGNCCDSALEEKRGAGAERRTRGGEMLPTLAVASGGV